MRNLRIVPGSRCSSTESGDADPPRGSAHAEGASGLTGRALPVCGAEVALVSMNRPGNGARRNLPLPAFIYRSNVLDDLMCCR